MAGAREELTKLEVINAAVAAGPKDPDAPAHLPGLVPVEEDNPDDDDFDDDDDDDEDDDDEDDEADDVDEDEL